MTRVLIAAPVHVKSSGHWRDTAFKKCLDALRKQELKDNVIVNKFFYFHNCYEDIGQTLISNESFKIYNDKTEYNADGNTHEWKQSNLNAVSEMKCDIIKKNMDDYDYIFFVDSDVILHPKTLQTLIDANKDIISEIFWTQWGIDKPNTIGPNCWDTGHYDFVGSITRFFEQKIHRVGGTGASILINTKVFKAGVDYSYLYNCDLWGEDRHFSLSAVAHGFELYVDTTFPARHIYRKEDLK